MGAIVVGLYGPLLDLPAAALDLAPFGLVPAVPSEHLEAGPLAAMGAVAVLLAGAGAGAGAVAFRRRDLVA
ncbi:hypothetical protein AB6N24_11800 [Cellulomonas sp. 179-A 4D5 NHS]|uniref:hypothetical protein n=1 Tax=Cellulomonas sp. 179-A 4D5 NHS TaxID=3142378 RepID=UPI00399F0404